VDLKPIPTKPYTSRTNSKAERFNKTVHGEWAYALPFQTSKKRNRWLPSYLGLYNKRRCHMALSSLSPQRLLRAE